MYLYFLRQTNVARINLVGETRNSPCLRFFCQYLHAPQTGTVGKLCQLKGRRTRLSPLEEFIMCHTIRS